jgi:hypothetical protein
MTIKHTTYDYLYYSTIANLPLEPTWVRENFTRMWEALDTIIERDYKLKRKQQLREDCEKQIVKDME